MNPKIKKVCSSNRYSYLKIDALNLKDKDLYFRDLKETSLGFNTGAIEKTIEYFIRVFDISNHEQFTKKFLESISGDGDELSKNNALHSSSLCALLFFYNIKNKPFVYKEIAYDNVFFEVKNRVIKNPSNMDVVLTGKDRDGNDSILFIECKFSEFIGARAYRLGKTYLEEPYKRIFDDFHYNEQRVFQYGLKQLVTHYLGIKNFILETNKDAESYKKEIANYYRKNDGRLSLYKKYKNVSFLEVTFDLKEEQDYQDYLKEVKRVFATLQKEKSRDSIALNLYGTTTYQALFGDSINNPNSNVLDPLVKDFYKIV